MRFHCPTCSQLMECADHLAGTKASCPKCGQKVLIPAPAPPKPPMPTNKTTLGKLEDVAESPTPKQVPQAPSTPRAARGKITKTAWIVIAGACAGVLALCTCGGGSLVYFKPFGVLGGPGVVGKWELAQGGQIIYEFKSDGTGSMTITNPMLPGGIKTDLKWSIDYSEKSPVLLIDATASKQQNAMDMPFLMLNPLATKSHYHFTREGNTLTLISIGRPGGSIAFRKVL